MKACPHNDNTDVVMQLEPGNETAAQFYPVIQERIQLGKESHAQSIFIISEF